MGAPRPGVEPPARSPTRHWLILHQDDSGAFAFEIDQSKRQPPPWSGSRPSYKRSEAVRWDHIPLRPRVEGPGASHESALSPVRSSSSSIAASTNVSPSNRTLKPHPRGAPSRQPLDRDDPFASPPPRPGGRQAVLFDAVDHRLSPTSKPPPVTTLMGRCRHRPSPAS